MNGHETGYHKLNMPDYDIRVFFVDDEGEYIDCDSYITEEQLREFLCAIKQIFLITQLNIGDEVSDEFDCCTLVEKEWQYIDRNLTLLLYFK